MRVASVGSVNLTGSDKYGNIEYLSYSMKDANALRFESPDTAGELLDLWRDVDELEQLCIE